MAYFQKLRLTVVREKGNYLDIPTQLNSPIVGVEWCKSFFPEMFLGIEEQFVAFFLNTKNAYLNHDLISKGSLNASIVHPREVMKRALEYNAASIMVMHNHPSGVCNPSKEDNFTTDNLKKACELLKIQLIDHIIVGLDDRYYSYKEENLL